MIKQALIVAAGGALAAKAADWIAPPVVYTDENGVPAIKTYGTLSAIVVGGVVAGFLALQGCKR